MNDQVPSQPHDARAQHHPAAQYQTPQPSGSTHPGHSAEAAPYVPSGPRTAESEAKTRSTMVAMWLAIGMLIAAALLGGFFIIVGDQSNVAGRAWLTLLLVGAFAGAVVLDARLATGPNRWYMTASTIVNAILVGVGLLKVWNGWLQPADTASSWVWGDQFFKFLAVIILLRAGIVFTQFYGRTQVFEAKNDRYRIAGFITLGFTWLTLLLLAIPAALPEANWPNWWWRVAGAAALVAVVSAVIPLIIKAFEPKDPKPAAPVGPWGAQPQPYNAQPTPYGGQSHSAGPVPTAQPQAYPPQPQAFQPQGYPAQPQAYPAQQQPFAGQPTPAQPQGYQPQRSAQQQPYPPQPQYGRSPYGQGQHAAPPAPQGAPQPQYGAPAQQPTAPAARPAQPPQPQYGRSPYNQQAPGPHAGQPAQQPPVAPAPAQPAAPQSPAVPAPAIPSLSDVEPQTPDEDTEISHRG